MKVRELIFSNFFLIFSWLIRFNHISLFQQKQKQNIMKTKANKSARTFIIRTEYAKYRTFKMTKQEFESAENWTENDWKQFLKTDEYSLIK